MFRRKRVPPLLFWHRRNDSGAAFGTVIADCQNIDRLQIIWKLELFFNYIWLEVAYPYAAKTKICCLKHHVVSQNCSIDIAAVFLIEWSYPRFIVVSTYNNSQRSTVDICSFSDLFKAIHALDNNQVNRLFVGSCRRNVGSF